MYYDKDIVVLIINYRIYRRVCSYFEFSFCEMCRYFCYSFYSLLVCWCIWGNL